MNLEEQLREIILSKYKSVRAFTTAFDIPYSTLDSVFKRGLKNSGIDTTLKIFNALRLDIESINTGILKPVSITKTEDVSEEEFSYIKKYRTLDGYGKNMVNNVLNLEFQRCTEQSKEEKMITLPLYEMDAEEPIHIIWLPEPLQPAAAGYGQAADDETAEQVPVRYNETTRKADYIMRVSGDSMEPKIHDDDRILVRAQPSIEEGEIGVFIRDSECVIKVYRGDYLESLNPQYGNLPFRGFSECKGLVIGVLRPEWIIKK